MAADRTLHRQWRCRGRRNQRCRATYLIRKVCCRRNWRVSFDLEFLHAIPQIVSGGISETRPVSKACQHVTSVIDSKFSVHSSECEQRILAASRSVRWALLHREREREGFELRVNLLTQKSFRQHRTSHSVTYTSAFRSYATLQLCSMN